MNEVEIDIALDRIITEFIVSSVGRLNERQMRLDSFITVQGLSLTDEELASVVTELGVARVQIEAMERDLIRVFREMVVAGAQSGRADAQRALGADRLYEWVSDGQDCPDCAERSGQVHSYAYWETVGIPRSGITICGANCKCTLNPAE